MLHLQKKPRCRTGSEASLYKGLNGNPNARLEQEGQFFIRGRFYTVECSEHERTIKKLLIAKEQNQNGETKGLKAEQKILENRNAIVDSSLKKVYEDRNAGHVPESSFQKLLASYTQEQTEIEEKLNILWKRIDEAKSSENDVKDWQTPLLSILILKSLIVKLLWS